MIIVDNSVNKEAVNSAEVTSLVKNVVATPSPLNFPQLHNFMAKIALDNEFTFYFWAHSDNYVLPMSENRDLGEDIIDCLRTQTKLYPNWGMV